MKLEDRILALVHRSRFNQTVMLTLPGGSLVLERYHRIKYLGLLNSCYLHLSKDDRKGRFLLSKNYGGRDYQHLINGVLAEVGKITLYAGLIDYLTR